MNKESRFKKITDYLQVNVHNIILISLFSCSLIMIVLAMIHDCSRTAARKKYATETGCTYIGSARDLKGVAFYSCNGSVVMKLDK